VLWRGGSALVSINKVNLHRDRYLILGRMTVFGFILSAGHLSRYVTRHLGQLGLAIPLLVGTMSTSQRAVMPCGRGIKAGMVCVWVADKTVWSRCYTRAISEHFPGVVYYMTKHSTNSRYFTSTSFSIFWETTSYHRKCTVTFLT